MKITLKNFQSHKDTTIELLDGITAIVGSTDNGKSSIIRAFEWVRTNRPTGVNFIRKKTKEAIVSIDAVIHKRTATVNSYKIGKKTYKALRCAVPEEVQKHLNIGDANIQTQHRSIFLLTDSPGKVAQKLSKLVDLEKPIQALKAIAARKREIATDIKSTEISLKETKQTLFELRIIGQANKDFIVIEQKRALIQKLKQTHTSLCAVLKNINKAQKQLNKIPNTDGLKPAKHIKALYQEIDELEDETAQIKDTLERIDSFQFILKADPSALITDANNLIQDIEHLNAVYAALKQLAKAAEEIKKLKTKEQKLQKEKDKLLKDRCPLCGRSG